MQWSWRFVLCFLAGLGLSAASGGAGWSSQPAFSTEPGVLLQASRSLDPVAGMPVVELLEETRIRFDAEGRRETRYRYIFRVDHESGLDGWRNIGTVWKPWNQEHPELKARVVTPDGQAHELDPATIGESPLQEDAKIFDDRKRLVAPLPQLCVGAVAEVEVVTRERKPGYPGGALVWINLSQNVPVLRTHVQVEVPEGSPLAWRVLGLPGQAPVKTHQDGRICLSMDLGRLEPVKDSEPHEPAQEYPRPVLLVSTATSWKSLAATYHSIVDRQLAGADLSRLAKLAEPGLPLRERVARVLQRIHAEIKYTGLEFGAASIVPHTPTEVLTRGYGDCKDKATLLVGALRQAGIQAYVALLDTGPGVDVEEDLPGLNFFDHAIVYIPGPEPLWVDATDDVHHAGELPFPDQGRRALVAAPDTTGLALTPRSTSADNLTRETRDVYLSDAGPARVVEYSWPAGLGEGRLRSEMANTEPKKLRENLARYAKDAYEARDLGTYEMSDSSDLSRPFTLKLECLDAKAGVTGDFDASVTINPWPLTERFRQVVPLPSEKDADSAKPRKHDVLFQEPYTAEWQYRIHPPQGFSARPLPADDRVTFGPASLSRAFKLEGDGTVLATFRFDSGKARWTPAEYETARKALDTFGQTRPTSLGFDLTAETYLNTGRMKESIRAYEALVAALPGKAAPRSKLAMALLQCGMGELAREQAEKACRLEPQSAYALRTLGYILLHDLVGRSFEKGWDRAGSIRALREAKRLDPKDKVARRNLAIVLEYNEAGDRYGDGAQLEEAIAEYRPLRDELKADDVDVNLMIDLARTGHLEELEQVAKSLAPSATRSTWMLVAASLRRGADAALREAPSIVPDAESRQSDLLSAGDTLIPLRRYQEASALMAAGAIGAKDAPTIRGKASFLAKTRRSEEVTFDPALPTSAVWSLFRALLVEGRRDEALAPFVTPELVATMVREGTGGDGEDPIQRAVGVHGRQGLNPRVAFDLVLTLTQATAEGDADRGYKVTLQAPGADTTVFYVSRLKGRYVVSAVGGEPALLGLEAARRLKEGDLAGAKAMLDWAREGAWGGSSEDPYTGALICRFWTKGQSATPDEVKVAAAALQATEKSATGILGILAEARTRTTDPAKLLNLDLARCIALFARDEGREMEPLARHLLSVHPDSKAASGFVVGSLVAQKRWDALLAFCDEQLARRPNDLGLLETRVHALSGLGRHDAQEQQLKDLVTRGLATAGEYNNLAWARLMAGNSDDQTLDYARRSLLLREGDGGSMHTLASILAERGEVTEALEVMRKMLQDANRVSLRGEDWYVFARIAEQFGERDLALARYRRVTPPRPGELEADSCHLLASRRITALTR